LFSCLNSLFFDSIKYFDLVINLNTKHASVMHLVLPNFGGCWT
jgi:hypothetical protein